METASEKGMKILSPPKKRSISSSEKHMILNVYKMELQLDPNILMHYIVKKAAYFTGVSECFIYRVIKEYKSTHILRSPQKAKPRKKFSDSVDEFVRNAIRRVHDFFFRHELPTIDKSFGSHQRRHSFGYLS
jgi:hypothetical protein